MASVEHQEVDFVVISEDYSRFVLKDGTILKAKVVLKKVFFSPILTPEGYPQGVGYDTVNAIAAMVPQGMRRKPTDYPVDVSKEKGTEIRFDEQEGKIQEYMTSNGFRITIKPVLTKVFRYDKYNAFGEPVYSAILQTITNVDKLESTG